MVGQLADRPDVQPVGAAGVVDHHLEDEVADDRQTDAVLRKIEDLTDMPQPVERTALVGRLQQIVGNGGGHRLFIEDIDDLVHRHGQVDAALVLVDGEEDAPLGQLQFLQLA